MSPPILFEADDADLVLISESPDEVKFPVHKCILILASPFFADMLSLPQPHDAPSNKIPTVHMSEPASVLEMLLRFVYPVADPQIETLDELSVVLHAAMKYDFQAVLVDLRRLLVDLRFVQAEPIRVFAIACRYDFEEEAKIASRYTLSVNVLDCPLSDDLKWISAHSYHRLLDLHRRRARAAQDLLKIPEFIKCMQCNQYGVPTPPRWWFEFERRAKEELALRPTSDCIFKMDFLAGVADASGCHRCNGSILDSYKFLDGLKKSIDELPATI